MRAAVLVASMLAVPALAGETAVPLGSNWTLDGAETRVETFEGRPTLRVRTGGALAPADVTLQDGTIDVDVQVTRQRTFVYLIFRRQADGEQEEFYLRPHKSTLGDAVQYCPAFQGSAAWQLWHGPDGTASPEIPDGRWLHLRAVLKGTQAAFFLDDMTKPVLVVPRLGRTPAAGGIALRGFVAFESSPDFVSARFANLVVRKDVVEYAFPPVVAPSPKPGIVTAWSVGPFFAPGTGAIEALPAAGPAVRATATPDGLVNLHEHVKVPRDVKRVATTARLTVKATHAGPRRFNLGFSDEVSVFLNGQLLYAGNARYSYNQPRREGLIELEQAALWLPLRAGDNEIAVTVADSFGGWGLMGQFPDASGLTVSAP